MVTLQEVKQYLRIDFEDDDPLLLSLIFTAKQLVMDVGTMLDGRRAVREKLIDELGGISDALAWLYREIER